MQKPEIPTNESDRLVALDRYKILDTLPEQVYDDLTQLAADICGTPIALISLVDKDRQWFKSRVGIDATETPRDISFCGHAVAANAILNVPDASLDPRFADNPLVTKDPSIRFYAGVPLITDDNFALGTLCVIDRQPHDLTEQQIRQLEALSWLVISQLELRLKEESLRILASVVESSVDAIITKTVEGIITSWNPAAERLFGYSEAEAIGQHISMLFPPERLDEEPQILARIMGGERVEHFETVRISKEGKRIEVSATISPLMNDAGEMVGISKIVRDISDRKRAEKVIKQQLASIEAAIDGIAILQDNNYIYLNKSHLEIFGYQHPEELLGRSWTELYSSEELIRFEQEIFPVLMQNQSWQGEAIATRKDGSTFNEELSLTINEGGFLICVCRDISDRKQAEQIILQQANRETLLRGITQRIRQSLDLSIIFDTACQEIQQLLQCDRVGIFKFYPESNFDDGEFVAEFVVNGFSSAMEVHIHDHCFGEGYAAEYAQGRMQVVNDIDNAGLMDCHRDVLAQFQVRANLAIPLLCGNNLWGLLSIHQCAHTRQWQEDEINLIQQIANQLAIAIQQASLYEQLQEELLIRQQSQSKIAQQLREQQTLATITNKIRESLSIKEILAVVTQQVIDVLSGDRAIIFQLFDNGNSQIVEESVHSNFLNLKALNWDNEVWSQEILDCYWQGKPRIVPDVMNDIWTECLVPYSIEGQIKSKIIAPILLESHNNENHRWVATDGFKKLWGVLVVHACAELREWKDSEAQLLQQIANQLAIAIQQASLYEQVQADLSIREQTEIQLIKVNDELLRATKLKDEFLANMSHELRTPLNSILGLSNALGEEILGSLNERQIKAIGTVESSGEHLLSLINDILDLSKISSGMMELNVQSVSVKNLCDSSLVFVKQQAFQKQVQIASNIPKNINNINIEERRIRQVLINLLTNAVKFTPSKGQVNLLVAVGCGDTWQGEATIPDRIKLMNSPMIIFQVVDTGIGIASNDLQRLFQPFVQVSSSLNRQYEGTGLGLALVKQIVELHGGQVTAESEVGKGSCFSVALPYDMSQSSAPKSPTFSTTLSPLRIDPDNAPLILLAEDNEANIQTFTSYLTAINYRIVIARNGIEAVAKAKSDVPDIILMDIQMPEMDGLEAITLIRADASIAPIPIIALTALAMEGDRERCLAAGANEYIAKPIKFRQLNTVIQRILI